MTGAAALTFLDPSRLEAHRRYLLRFALGRVSERGAAEDLVQEVFLAALGSAQAFRGRSSLRTWLTGVLVHKLADHHRRQALLISLDAQRDAQGEDSIEELFRENGSHVRLPGAWRDPEQALTDRRFFQAFEGCLQRVPGTAAHAFLLREMAGLSTEEICKELNVSATNCHVLLHRARLRLRDCLERRWFAPEGKASSM